MGTEEQFGTDENEIYVINFIIVVAVVFGICFAAYTKFVTRPIAGSANSVERDDIEAVNFRHNEQQIYGRYRTRLTRY
jgi:heme/copper-type cytochrome/quinol oxidase subunit 3